MTALGATGHERGPQPRSKADADGGLTIAHRLEHHALVDPDHRAFSFLGDGDGVTTRTWAELAAGASAVAAVLADLPRTQEQPRALLLLPDDATFLDALFGCFYAGVCAVPAHIPIPSRLAQTLPRLLAIVADARPDVVLTTRQILPARELVPALADIPCIAVDDLGLGDGAPAPTPESTVSLEDLAILQYSSGSSGTPRGVMVSHANLMANEAMIEDAFGHTSSTVALGWLPFQHDMGLAGLDLSSWELAFVGAEPVRAATLDRFEATFAKVGFRREAFYPCYGLAEATLIVSGGRRDTPPTAWRDPNGPARVSCGRVRLSTELTIVDRARGARCDDGVEGEIWVHGPSVAAGYFGDEEASRETFAATLDGTPENSRWLRTGDLGCIVDGELYITGRAKDVVVKNGVNYAAEDLETTVEQLRLESLHANGCAAFSHDDGLRERLVIVSEIARDAVAAWSEVADRIVAAVATAHGTPADSVVFVNRGGIPRTTSGKIRRSECRALYSRGELVEVHRHLTERRA